jgi:hypothetical protein
MARYDEHRRKWAGIRAAREAIVLDVIQPGKALTKAEIRDRAAAKCGARWSREQVKTTFEALLADGRLVLTGRTTSARYFLPPRA